MSDFETVNPTSGVGTALKLAGDRIVIGADTVFFPRQKVVHGPDGSQVDTSTTDPFPTTQPNRTDADSHTATGSSVVTTTGCGSVGVQITGTWAGEVTFEATINGTDFFGVQARVITTGAAAPTTTANGQWLIPCAGYAQVRARVSTFTSGTIAIALAASGHPNLDLLAALLTGTVFTAALGTGGVEAEITDGTLDAAATVTQLLRGLLVVLGAKGASGTPLWMWGNRAPGVAGGDGSSDKPLLIGGQDYVDGQHYRNHWQVDGGGLGHTLDEAAPSLGGTPTDATTRTITTGGASQTPFAANPDRAYLLIQNLSNTVLWVNFGAAANQDHPSIALKACAVAGDGTGGFIEYEGTYIPTSDVRIIGPTTGSKFSAKEG